MLVDVLLLENYELLMFGMLCLVIMINYEMLCNHCFVAGGLIA
jgi:hypothetical protein